MGRKESENTNKRTNKNKNLYNLTDQQFVTHFVNCTAYCQIQHTQQNIHQGSSPDHLPQNRKEDSRFIKF